MASVEKRGDLSWRVVWRRGGRGAPKQSATFPTEREAEAACRLVEARHGRITAVEVYAAVLGRADADDVEPTLAEWSKTWIAKRRDLARVQDDTIDDQVTIILRRILPKLGHLPLSHIDQDRVEEWVGWMKRQPSRNGGVIDADTVRKAHTVLHSLLGAAVPRWLTTNPAARSPGQAKILPETTPHEALFLTAAETEAILAECTPMVRDMAYVTLRTGLRLGELLVLRVRDVQLTGRRMVRVRRALKRNGAIGTPKSARSRRNVSISPAVAEIIQQRVKDKRPDDLIFTTPTGKTWSRSNLRSQQWLPALAAAQRCREHPPPLPPKPARGPRRRWRVDEVSTCECPTRLRRSPRWHDLRHTHVSLCVEAEWTITRVSRRIGHKSIKTTIDLYGHLWETDDADRLDAVERLLLLADDEDDEDGNDGQDEDEDEEAA